MDRAQPFPAGSPIVWRSRPGGQVGFVFACRVLVDGPAVAAVVQPPGAPVARRVGQRGGPGGRSLLPGWDGAREVRPWHGPPMVRLHPVGRAYAVIRAWLPDEGRFHGWYVNLEQPWRRTAIGFDTRDDVLDVTVSDDLRAWHLKDEDELDFAVEKGTVTADEAQAIRSEAAAVEADIAARRWPFVESAWHDVRPTDVGSLPDLPAGWADP